MTPADARATLHAAKIKVADLVRLRVAQGDTRPPKLIRAGFDAAFYGGRAQIPWYADMIVRLTTQSQVKKEEKS